MNKTDENKSPKTRVSWRKTLTIAVIEIAVLLALHGVLLHSMAKVNLASMIFTGGGDVSPLTLATVALFFVVRLLVTLGLPGIILAKAGLVLWDYRTGRESH